MSIEKNGGCQKVICGMCNAFMCWKCGKIIQGCVAIARTLPNPPADDESGYYFPGAAARASSGDAAPRPQIRRGTVWWPPGGPLRYDHFSQDGCQLFDDEEVMRLRLLEMQERRRAAVRAPPEGWHGARDIGAPSKGCPFCRARVAKFDQNNHIQCWRVSRGGGRAARACAAIGLAQPELQKADGCGRRARSCAGRASAASASSVSLSCPTVPRGISLRVRARLRLLLFAAARLPC